MRGWLRLLATMVPLVFATALGCLWGAAPGPRPAGAASAVGAPAPVSVPEAGSLRVEAVLATREAQPGSSVMMTFRVTNVSHRAQAFSVMNCDWISHWSTDTPLIGLGGWGCSKNFAYTETLAPGATYERSDEVFVKGSAPYGELTFRVDFRPFGASVPLWSDPVTLRVVRGPLARANLWGTCGTGALLAGILGLALRRRPEQGLVRLSWGRRSVRSLAALLLATCLGLLAASHWRALYVDLRVARAQALGGTLEVFLPARDPEFLWQTDAVDQVFPYTANAYADASFHCFGFAWRKDGEWDIMVPLWLPCVASGLLVGLAWWSTARRQAAFPVVVADGAGA